MTKQNKGFLLVGLLVLWGILMFFQFSEESPPSGFSVNPFKPSSQQIQKPPTPSNLTKIFKPARRTVSFSNPQNIFAPLTFNKPASPARTTKAKTVVANTPKAVPRKPPPPPGPSPAELATQRARQQLNQYRFLGYLKKGGESQAFLTNGKDIYIVRQGEIMEGRIHVSKIKPNTIVLSTKVKETGDHVEATIPLTKEQKG